MKKLKLIKDTELAFKKEISVYCDFCGEADVVVFTSSFDEGESVSAETQICVECVSQLYKHI